ncbi:LysR family transcriptional regulator [Yoonia sediminilitoris]|uniref:DNA-binding transcriptional LysR family regulator n=1 Tax=Yoonia sediminilitoris TaxID=1286148 RepID=A0A2T6KJL6_9RHOB|nr:LysR family transcriptional regulator [Yoonia sediminilitoris]PUB16157.1 DNA-binding transcriptional LysR family regulator [Yoonia sediminilitoris]RCW96506.1 DNA-binding transcriptional LysR family regulator [Yoonia sediminilitoris]
MERISNINNILAFVTVAREGSVSRAADVLNLTQPAISHQIKRLSEETGITLFTRSATGLSITPDGSAMLEKAEQVLQAMAEFRRHASKRVGHVSGKLKIGTIVDPEFIRLGRLLALLRSEHPDIETELVHGVSGDILKWLKQGRIDAGFYLSGPDDLPGIGSDNEETVHTIKLADFTYRVIAPDGWQKQVENADWASLAALPWIGTPEKSVHHRLLASVFKNLGCRPNVVALVDQEPSMLEMVRSGIGLSLCRDSIALHQKQTFGLVVADAVSVPACLCFIALDQRKDNPMLSETFKLLQRSW